MSPTLAEVSEEEVLATILPLLPRRAQDPVGPGDDAAVLATAGRLIATTDTMVRGRDWLDEWSSPAEVAGKCLTQNLADVAAMGGRPTSVLVTIVADPATPMWWVGEFAQALGREAAAAGVGVAGGDLSSAPVGTLVVSVVAFGELDGVEPVLRSGARAGDIVAVAGSLGRSAAGLLLLRSGLVETGSPLVAAHRHPVAPIAQGPVAARAGASAMIDISDGLLRDGDRVGRASSVLLDLSADSLAWYAAELESEVSADDALECVLTGGEEHSLLACFPADATLPDGWRVVGMVRPGLGVALDGVAVAPAGWDHFGG